MTIEDFNKAKELIVKIQSLDNNISELKNVLSTSTLQDWIMEIRPNTSCSLKHINHMGLLPDFLNEILDKHLAERDELVSKLEAL